MFENKKKIIIFFIALFLVVFLLVLGCFYAIKYYKYFSEIDLIKEDVCRSFPLHVELSPVVDYIIPKKKFQPWKPLDNIYSLKEQYVFCLLFQSGGDKDKAGLTSSLSGDNEQFFKEYEILSAVNKIFEARNCSSIKVLEYATILKELLPVRLGDISKDEVCTLLKTENSLLEKALGGDDLNYLGALRNNDKERCQEIEDMYISIACQSSFIKDKSPFCDKIYNEIKKEACD